MSQIVGWKDLEEKVGRCYSLIEKWVAYYGFPKGNLINVKLNGRNCKFKAWDALDVQLWLLNNRKLLEASERSWKRPSKIENQNN